MSNKDKREALAAAASVFCAADVPASEVIEHAQAFEEYLAGGRVTLATDSEFTESRARMLHQLADFVSAPGYLGLANWLRSVAVALEISEPWPLPARVDGRSEDDVAANARLNLLIRLQRVAKGAGRSELVSWLGKVSDTLDRNESSLPEPPLAGVDTLTRLAKFVTHQPDLAYWLKRTAAAIAAEDPLPPPPAATRVHAIFREDEYGALLDKLGQAATAEPRVARWLADVRTALDVSSEPAAVELPRLEPEANPRDPFATAPWGVKGSVEPPAEVRAVSAANGATLERTNWKTADGYLWEWYGLGLTGYGPRRWDEALELAPDSAFPLNYSMEVDVPRHELREEYPVAEQRPPVSVDREVGHDDPARSTNPSRYETRTIGDGSADDPEREVLVCLTCIEQQGPSAGAGNITNVERHDAYHAEQDGGVHP